MRLLMGGYWHGGMKSLTLAPRLSLVRAEKL
jgi:hypothetical protein